jgi:hypothetical protein
MRSLREIILEWVVARPSSHRRSRQRAPALTTRTEETIPVLVVYRRNNSPLRLKRIPRTRLVEIIRALGVCQPNISRPRAIRPDEPDE